MNKPRCETCIHWQRLSGHVGECTSGPPRQVPSMISQDVDVETSRQVTWMDLFPETECDEDCGHHNDHPSYLEWWTAIRRATCGDFADLRWVVTRGDVKDAIATCKNLDDAMALAMDAGTYPLTVLEFTRGFHSTRQYGYSWMVSIDMAEQKLLISNAVDMTTRNPYLSMIVYETGNIMTTISPVSSGVAELLAMTAYRHRRRLLAKS